MEKLLAFEQKVMLYDGMLIETGGSFGKGRLGGDQYQESCLEVARSYLAEGGSREALLEILDHTIHLYDQEMGWRYLAMELAFLRGLKERVEQL